MPQQLTDSRDPVNALYYGDGGTGKSTHLASMAHLGKVFLVNAESGLKQRPLKQRGIPVENIEIFPGPGEELTFDSLEEQWNRIREELHKDPEAYAGVGWDSVTELIQILLDGIAQDKVKRANRAGKERNRHLRTQEDYGDMTAMVRELMRKFRDLPCHFGVTALPRRTQDDDGSVTYTPGVTPAVAQDLNLWIDVVCHTSVALVGPEQEEEFRGLFRPHNKYRGKDRLNALPKWLVDPTFDRIVAYVDDELDVDSDPVMVAARERAAATKETAPETETKEDSE